MQFQISNIKFEIKIVVYATNCKNRRFCRIAKYKMGNFPGLLRPEKGNTSVQVMPIT
jgi:hypothetical protein